MKTQNDKKHAVGRSALSGGLGWDLKEWLPLMLLYLAAGAMCMMAILLLLLAIESTPYMKWLRQQQQLRLQECSSVEKSESGYHVVLGTLRDALAPLFAPLDNRPASSKDQGRLFQQGLQPELYEGHPQSYPNE